MQHYCFVECFFPRTQSTCVCDTVTFLPHAIPFPTITVGNYMKQAAEDIITILTQPPKTTVPSLQAGDPVRAALLELAKQLQRIEPLPDSP